MTQEQGKQARGAKAPTWGPAEAQCCQRLLELALAEDLGQAGDVTSQALLPLTLRGQAAFIARTDGIIAGLPAAHAVLRAVDRGLVFGQRVEEGAHVRSGAILATVTGPLKTMLTAERTALNFLQRLSGVASQTGRYVNAIRDLPCQLLDTRKTTPGWRTLEKYAVRCGGGQNHRQGLYDLILIKDNHLGALRDFANPIAEAIRRARALSAGIRVEVEVDSVEQLDRALAERPDIVLLDNMAPELLRKAVARRRQLAPDVKLEASGGVTLATVRAIAETGVDFVSVGALTHSAFAMDIALDVET